MKRTRAVWVLKKWPLIVALSFSFFTLVSYNHGEDADKVNISSLPVWGPVLLW